MNAESHYDSTQTVLPKPLLRRFAKQIAFGVLCSCIATAIVQFAHIKQAVLYACSAVTFIGGDPLKGEKGMIKKGEDKLKEIQDKMEEKAHKIGHLPAHMPSLHKTPEQLETEARLKEEREKREHESKRKSVVARLEAMGVPFDPEASLEKLLVDLREAEDTQHKRPLIERADKMGLHIDPREPYDVLQKRIKEAEADADYQEQMREYERRLAQREEFITNGPNARCPNPKCHYQFRTQKKMGNYRCPRCSGIFTIGKARAHWTPPPMPTPPKRKSSVMDRVKGLFGR